jgi:hypothetical protein
MSMDGKDKLSAGVAIASVGYLAWDGYKTDSTLTGGYGPIVPAISGILVGGACALLGGWFFGRKWAGAAVGCAGLAAWNIYDSARDAAGRKQMLQTPVALPSENAVL